jgi:transposase
MATCSVCDHPQLREIDAALVAGVSQREIGRRFDLSKDNVRRHFDSHLSAGLAKLHALPATQPTEAAPDPREELVAEVDKLRQIATGLMGRAYSEGRVQQSLSAIREARGLLELRGRLQGALDNSPKIVVVNLQSSNEWIATRSAISVRSLRSRRRGSRS